ncbi:hypothetical protein, partial [Porphyromonas pogonae]|uniref:hypothetical protein n=1 Tax=Porphyromonas pogonae TaxID=867595 RepID=UPI00300E82B3
LGHPANLHFFDALPDLLECLGASSPWREDGKRGIAGDRMRPPAELRDAFEQALRTISHDRIVTRLNTVTAVGAIGTAAAPRLRPMTRAEDA